MVRECKDGQCPFPECKVYIDNRIDKKFKDLYYDRVEENQTVVNKSIDGLKENIDITRRENREAVNRLAERMDETDKNNDQRMNKMEENHNELKEKVIRIEENAKDIPDIKATTKGMEMTLGILTHTSKQMSESINDIKLKQERPSDFLGALLNLNPKLAKVFGWVFVTTFFVIVITLGIALLNLDKVIEILKVYRGIP